MCGASAATETSGHAGMERVFHLLWCDKVDVAVEPAGGQDTTLARDNLGARSNDDIDVGLGIGVAGLTDPRNPPVFQRHVRLVDARVIHD